MSTIAPPRPRSSGKAASAPGSRSTSNRLGTYTDGLGRTRELVPIKRARATTLVLDRVAGARGALADARLIAHLAADEPSGNAKLVAALYLAAPRPSACRAVSAADLHAPGEGVATPNGIGVPAHNGGPVAEPLLDRRGSEYALECQHGSLSIAELRWRRRAVGCRRPTPVSVRAAIGALEAYEPVLGLTRAALARHEGDPRVSVVVLRGEYERTVTSPIVLNRALREAVERLTAQGELSASEIATRCGRVRRGPRGQVSGETSWLARRIGQAPEPGASEPTPWVHSDVLALIAREGLSLNPNEVEM